MPNSKRKQEVIKADLSGYTQKEIHELCEKIKTEMETSTQKLCVVPTTVAFPKNTAFLKADEIESGALWYFWRMPTYYDHDLWWGWTSWEAFGWWEGENPFKDWWAISDDYFTRGDITYLKSLDYKGEEKNYSEPQGERAYFIVSDLKKALDALEKFATSFSLCYEDGVVKLRAWNEEKPDFRACLMVKYDWGDWCDSYYKNYSDFGWKLLEWTYGINTPDPVWKDGKLFFGDEFSKTPEEFIYDLATLEPPTD